MRIEHTYVNVREGERGRGGEGERGRGLREEEGKRRGGEEGILSDIFFTVDR